jgi:hypothetical protein
MLAVSGPWQAAQLKQVVESRIELDEEETPDRHRGEREA